MKRKIILGIAILASVLFTSCSTDETTETGLQTTSVALSVASQSTTTSKQIQRGDIPVWVNVINIKATYNSTPAYFVEDHYDLVSNTQTNITKIFTLDAVAIGNNTFVATTTTDSAKKYVLAPITGDTQTVVDNLKKNNPYVIYTGTTTQGISGTGLNTINLDMKTLNGRLISVFQLENDNSFKNNYEATITAKADGESIAGTTKLQNSGLVYFEFSSDKAVDGKKVVYTIDVTPKNNNSNIHTIYTVEQVVKASTSISCIYTITKDKAPSPYTNENKLVFSFQKWSEETCETCKN